jgi:hypothetical protein
VSVTSAKAALVVSLVCIAGVASPQAGQQRVAFVGCPADGQVGYIEPALEEPKTVGVTEVSASEIAYYKGSRTPGVFAPSGWHCHDWYGSGGDVLLVTPEVLDSAPGSAWPPKTLGQAVELDFDSGENSGRYTVAKYALLFFPQTTAKLIQEANRFDEQISQDSLLPFAKDSIQIVSATMAEFITPSNTTGLGTVGYLGPSTDRIRGIALLNQPTQDYADFVTLRIRLNAGNSKLEAPLLRLNRECMQEGPCSNR